MFKGDKRDYVVLKSPVYCYIYLSFMFYVLEFCAFLEIFVCLFVIQHQLSNSFNFIINFVIIHNIHRMYFPTKVCFLNAHFIIS